MPESRSLSAEEEVELEQYLLMGLELVPLPEDIGDIDARDPALLVLGVGALLDALRSGAELPEGLDIESVSTSLGVLLGEELCRVVGWTWRHLLFEDGFEGLAVASRDQGLAMMPIHYIYGLISQPDQENTLGMLFAMIQSGDTPEVSPGDWRILG